MLDLHIDDFNRDCVKILLRLFTAFPQKHTIYLDEICGPDQKDEYGVSSDRHQRCMGAMLWLADEAMIRISDVLPHQGIDQASLTLNTYTCLLNISPEHASGSENFITAFRDAIKSGSSTQINAAAERFIATFAARHD